MSFKVSKQYGRGPETTLGERFKTAAEAKKFVDEKITEEAAMNVKVVYRIYDFDELHSEYDSSKVELPSAAAQDTQGGKGSTASFRPTPLNTAPRPPGTPPKWIVDEEDKDKK